MIDDQAKRLAALRNQVPNIVILTLFAMAAVAMAFTGYGEALEARRTRIPIYVMALVLSAVILLILDLDRPTTGFIEVSQQPMIDAAASIAAFPD
jgi:Na+/glutamate symporter